MRALAAVLLTAAISLGLASSSQAQPGPARTPRSASDSLKQACETAIDNRLSRITTLQNVLNGSQHVTSAHKSTLTSQLSAATSGLTGLKTKIDGDSDAATLRTDCRSIAEDYRIYVLVSPKVREVIVSDIETDIATRLDAIAAKIQSAIDKAKTNGKDVTTAQSDLDAMKTQIAAAKTAIGSVASSVIDLQPSDWPGAHDAMVTGRQSLRTGRNDLRSARDDGRNAVQALRQS